MKHPSGSKLDRCVSRPDAGHHNDVVKVFRRLGGRSKLDRNGEVLSLLLDGCHVTDEACARLSALANLEQLNLRTTRITDAALEHLSGLANLQILNLAGTQITDAGVRHLAGLTRLRKLILGATSVSDATLMHLTNLGELEELTLLRRNTSLS